MNTPQTPHIISPEFKGMDPTKSELARQATEWIRTTPSGTDPRIYLSMSSTVLNLFEAAIYPIADLTDEEKRLKILDDVRDGLALGSARVKANHILQNPTDQP